jgi:hypothetical protein
LNNEDDIVIITIEYMKQVAGNASPKGIRPPIDYRSGVENQEITRNTQPKDVNCIHREEEEKDRVCVSCSS